MRAFEYTAVIEKRGKWFVGYVEELPGVNTQGLTLTEVRRNLREALRMVIRANRELGRKCAGNGIQRERMIVRV